MAHHTHFLLPHLRFCAFSPIWPYLAIGPTVLLDCWLFGNALTRAFRQYMGLWYSAQPFALGVVFSVFNPIHPPTSYHPCSGVFLASSRSHSMPFGTSPILLAPAIVVVPESGILCCGASSWHLSMRFAWVREDYPPPYSSGELRPQFTFTMSSANTGRQSLHTRLSWFASRYQDGVGY